MKRLLPVALVLALAVSYASYVMAGAAPNSGIDATVHDLHANYPASPTPDALNRICIYCHAPHKTFRLTPGNGGPGVGSGQQAPDDAFDYLPLWNHDLTGNYGAYTMYQNGPGAPQTGPKASQALLNGLSTATPGGVSLLCLSCHDGSISINAYGNGASGGGPTISGQYVIGESNVLANHHPIGFNYDQVRGAGGATDPEIRNADTASFGAIPGTVRNHLFGPGNTQMECATCHSVHNKGNTGEKLLWRSDVSSNLCLTCHDKAPAP